MHSFSYELFKGSIYNTRWSIKEIRKLLPRQKISKKKGVNKKMAGLNTPFQLWIQLFKGGIYNTRWSIKEIPKLLPRHKLNK